MTNHTCGRCGISDARVLDLDTGGAYHRDGYGECIAVLRERLAEIQKSEAVGWLCQLRGARLVYLTHQPRALEAVREYGEFGYTITPLIRQPEGA